MLEEDMAILPDLLQLCAEKGIQLCASDDAAAEIEVAGEYATVDRCSVGKTALFHLATHKACRKVG